MPPRRWLTAGNATWFEDTVTLISDASGCAVVFPEYRLAPEAPFPAAMVDCLLTISWLLRCMFPLGLDSLRMMVAGDSAGASLANACLLELPANVFRRAYEIYPLVDCRPNPPNWSIDAFPCLGEQRAEATNRIDSTKGAVPVINELYLQGRTTPEDPCVSALLAAIGTLSRFPPTTIVTSEFDYLRLQGKQFAAHLEVLGVPTRIIRFADCGHGFLELLGSRPQVEDLCLDLARELRKLAREPRR